MISSFRARRRAQAVGSTELAVCGLAAILLGAAGLGLLCGIVVGRCGVEPSRETHEQKVERLARDLCGDAGVRWCGWTVGGSTNVSATCACGGERP